MGRKQTSWRGCTTGSLALAANPATGWQKPDTSEQQSCEQNAAASTEVSRASWHTLALEYRREGELTAREQEPRRLCPSNTLQRVGKRVPLSYLKKSDALGRLS